MIQATTLQTSVLTTPSDIEAVAEDWTRLQWHPRTVLSNYLSVNALRPKAVGLIAITCSMGNRIEAVLAGWLEETTHPILNIGFKWILAPQVRKIIFEYGCIMGSFTPEMASSIFEALKSELKAGKADIVQLRGVPVSNKLVKLLNCDPLSINSGMNDTYSHWMIDVANNHSEVMKKIHKLHRRSRTPEKLGYSNLRITQYSTPDEVTLFCDIADDISRHSVKNAIGYPFRRSAEAITLYRKWADNNIFYGYTLSIDDTPTAYLLAYIYNGTLYFNQSSYRFSYKRACPGIYLLVKVLEELIETGNISKIDFDPGNHVFKQRLGTECSVESDFHLYSFRPYSLLMYCAHKSVKIMQSFRRHVIPSFNIQQFIRDRSLQSFRKNNHF